MGKVLITYDLCRPGQDYQMLFEAIKSLGPARKILQSTWVVKTSMSATTVKNYLNGYIDLGDKLFVTQFVFWSGVRLSLTDAQWLSRP